MFVIGTERHESRRIDNQLRGRSGRQGDPGASRFFLSLEDDLMRIFGSDRMGGMLQKLGLKEGEAITHSWINKALEKAQKKVEARNFDTRKNLLKYDDVMNDQRREVYSQRRLYMDATDLSETIAEMRHETVHDLVRAAIPENSYPEQWDLAGLDDKVRTALNLDLGIEAMGREEGIDDDAIMERIQDAADRAAAARAADIGPEMMRMVEKSLLLQLFDQVWKEHLLQLDHLRQGIGLRAYGQRDPLNEYKSEAFNLFNAMLEDLRGRVTSLMMRVELRPRGSAADARAGAHHRHAARRTRWRRLRCAGRRRPGPAARPRGGGPERRLDLGGDAQERAMPLRFGQEIQALSRSYLRWPSAH